MATTTTGAAAYIKKNGTTGVGYAATDGNTYYKPYTNYTDTTNSQADQGILSPENYAKVQEYKAQYDAAKAAGDTAGMEAAHQSAEQIRNAAGYSGGVNGGAYNVMVRPGTSGGSGLSGGYGSSGSSGNYGSSGAGGVNDYSDYLKEMYNAQIESNLAALNNAYQKNVNTLDTAASKLPAQYQQARNQTAGAAAQSQRNFNQFAAAAGLNTGSGAQAQLANNVTLQNNLNTVDTAEADALSDLELQRTNLATEYQNAIVQARADGNYQLASALYQESVRVDEALQAQQQYLSNLAFQQQQYASNLELQQQQIGQNQANTEYDRGLELATYLFNATGDASGFAAYGYTPAQISAMQQQWAEKNTPTATAAAGTGRTSASVSNGSGNTSVNTGGNVTPGTATIVASNTTSPAYSTLLNELRDYMKDVALGSLTTSDVVKEIQAALNANLITAGEAEQLANTLGV